MQIIKPPVEGSKLTNGIVPELATFSIGMNRDSSPESEESCDVVDELKPVPKPRAMPRHFSAPSALRLGVVNGHNDVIHERNEEENVNEREEEGEDGDEVLLPQSNENHPTPSRSAPAPPNVTSHQPQTVGSIATTFIVHFIF